MRCVGGGRWSGWRDAPSGVSRRYAHGVISEALPGTRDAPDGGRREPHGTPSSASLPPGCVVLHPPQPGDPFVVRDRLAIMTVEVCHLGVSDNDGFTRFLVRAPD